MARFEAEVEIIELGARGDGIARAPDGSPLYVPFALPGDRVRVRLGAARGNGAEARLLAVVAPGPGRIEPACLHFGTCGGCALQHLDADRYRDWKRDLIVTALARRGLEADEVLPVVTTPPESRRRAILTAVRRSDDLLLGFNARATNTVIDLAECPVLEPAIVALLPALRSVLAEVLPKGGRAVAAATATDGGLDLVLVGPIRDGVRARERLAAFAHDNDLARIAVRLPDQRQAEPVAERRPVRAVWGGVAVELPPGAFLQASAAGEAALTGFVTDAVAGARTVADLYAGCGTFTLPLATAGAAVHAVDGDEAAMTALQRAAAAAALNRVTVEQRDLARRPLFAEALGRFQAVLFDPPRAGAREQAAALAASPVERVVAISCNPGTFARDARILADGGYRLARLLPVDQFLWSPQMELAALFLRGR